MLYFLHMDELEISGRRYISSARAAKEHKYHSDYIGQLVRGGKVVGQKVGRAWYVDADSLAEYLGKEVPLRGPVAKKEKPEREAMGSEDRSLTSISDSATDLSSEPSQVPSRVTESEVRSSSSGLEQNTTHLVDENPFLMPLRKSARAHIIAAIDDAPQAAEVKEIQEINEVEEIKRIELEPVEEEEETFIPVKITSEKTRNIYAEPEDSFYKVSRKGLRYVSASTPTPVAQKVFADGKHYAAPSTRSDTRPHLRANNIAKFLSVVLTAGILSLGVGVLMSYYLHSTTTVKDSGQTSSVILSN